MCKRVGTAVNVSGVFCVKCVSKNKKERCKKKKMVVRPAMCYRLETAVLSRKTAGTGQNWAEIVECVYGSNWDGYV